MDTYLCSSPSRLAKRSSKNQKGDSLVLSFLRVHKLKTTCGGGPDVIQVASDEYQTSRAPGQLVQTYRLADKVA